MKKRLIFFLGFILCVSVFSQPETDYYRAGINAFNQYEYGKALQEFQKASTYFLENGSYGEYIKSELFIANIDVYRNDFDAALERIDATIGDYKSLKLSNDSLYGELYNTKAHIYRLDGKAIEALRISENLLGEQLKNISLEKFNLVKTYAVRSRILILLGRYDVAISGIQKAFELCDDKVSNLLKAELFNNLGSAYLLKDDYDKAQKNYEKAYELKLKYHANLYDLAITAFNIGIIHEARGDYNRAVDYYKLSSAYDLKNQGEEVGFISDIYVALSNVYSRKNDLEKAEEYIEKALNVSIETFGEENINVANVYTSYARILRLKEKGIASLVFDEKALKIRERSNGVYNQFPIENLISMATTYASLGELSLSEEKYMEALRRIKRIKSKPLEAESYIGLASLKHQQKDFGGAVQLYKRSVAIYTDLFHKSHKYTLETELLLAKALFYDGKYSESLKIVSRHFGLEKRHEHEFPLLLVEAAHIYNLLALAEWENAERETSLEESFNRIETTLLHIQDSKKEYTSEGSIIDNNKRLAAYFDKTIELCAILYEITNHQIYIEKAFRLSEINRNSALLAGIQDESFKKMARVPTAVLEKENELKQKLAKVKKQIHLEGLSSKKADSLMSLRLNYSSQLDALLTEIETRFPKYYQLKYSNFTIPISNIQEAYLTKESTLLEYYLGQENLYVFNINKSKVNFLKLPVAMELKELASQYRNEVIEQRENSASAKELYSVLLSELYIRKYVIVVTDDVLNYIPFEALVEDRKFILSKHTISYAGSATLLKAQEDQFESTEATTSWMGFAPLYSENNSLSASQKEVEDIAHLMKGTSFLGEQASLENFRKQLGNSSIIHLAGHAEVDQQNPMYNKLIFSGKTEAAELTASEIYTMRIPSEMVVLSACNTGFGKMERGEGIMSMSRAFHYAGAKSTVMSLWKVPDTETAIIMHLFYIHLRKGESKNEALRNAKLDYLETTDDIALKHPFYWAGFVLSGNTEPLERDISYRWLLFLVLIPLIIFRKKLFKFL